MRFTRSSMIEVLNNDYIRTARAKGASWRRVVFIHALKNALIPVVTLLGPMFAAVGTGSFFVESIFRVPGMGRFFVLSMTGRDYPMIMAVVLTYGAFLAVMNLVVVPLSAFPRKLSFPPLVLVTGLFVHMFFIGVPIALAARRAVRGTATRQSDVLVLT